MKKRKSVWKKVITGFLATVLLFQSIPEMLAAEENTENWTFDVYYVNEENLYDTKKTEDFTLKYQMEFHAGQNLEPGAVEIRIPKVLLTYRDGTEILPVDIAVPQGTPEQITVGKNTPFNYYVEEDELVFFNYKEMISGTNAAFQVLYKNLEVMKIVDMTEWSLQPRIQVGTAEQEESRNLRPLTGRVDTRAVLSSVTKKAYTGGQSYTPGLYTKKQVEAYITGGLPEEYEQHFEDYRYVVWEVKANGSGTQPFELELQEYPWINGGITGSIVGAKGKQGFTVEEPVDFKTQTAKIRISGDPGSWSGSLYVVTAYPAETVQPGVGLNNEATIKLTPLDGKDPAQKKTDQAMWAYIEHEWNYPGNIIQINKERNLTYESWLEVYRYAKENQEDKGDFPFQTRSTCRGYGYTHITSGTEVGKYREGTYYTVSTADDRVVAFTDSGEDARPMTGEDYYFTEVEIVQKDRGYDVWENDFSVPENENSVDQKLSIYAVFADNSLTDSGEVAWEHVEDVPWSDTGELRYQFTARQLKRKPWKVKAVHQSINYQTTCEVNVKLRLRYDSPVMGELLEENPDQIIVKNISGVTAKGDNGNLQTGKQDDAEARLTGLKMHAAAYKTAKTSNDAVNGRALVEYCLTAHDGYLVESEEDAAYLRRCGVKTPGRKTLVFYDLLPYGMRFDPSSAVKAGRLTNLNYSGIYNTPKSWDAAQVDVNVDSERDIIENYKGTGRTMVIFHLTYLGADSSVVTRKDRDCTYWMEGWGVSFQAYYDWKDEQTSQANANICAFMPEGDDTGPLLGTEQEVACDDGIIVPDGFAEEYHVLGADINQDGMTDIRNVLYARTLAPEDIALASQSDIQKLVRADDDRFGIYQKSAKAAPAGGYTYDITVTNTSMQPMKNIVVFDRLEHAATDRNGVPNELDFEDSWWYGTYQSIILDSMKGQDIAPVVYYNESRDALISEGTQSPGEVLAQENGWFSKEEWEASGKSPEEVRAVAVDIGEKADGEPFVLGHLESATFQIKMKAPETVGDGVVYAYNNPAFYSVTDMNGTETVHTVAGNSVQVSLGGSSVLEIEKSFRGEIPERFKSQEFELRLTREEEQGSQQFANQEYQLWRKGEDGNWKQEDGLYATNADGILTLHAGEKAVFRQVRDVAQIQVKEEENPFWHAEQTDTTTAVEGGEKRTVQVANTYRPVLYVQKKLLAVPEGLPVEDETFTFQILSNGELLANAEFWYVDSARTDGGIPKKILTSGKKGTGKTDEKGRFSIREKDIIALFPGKSGTKYILKELTDEKESDWLCKTDTVKGILPDQGAAESITNIYRWKSLYLTKRITHQDAAACTQAFSFRITDADGIPLSGNRWVLLEDGKETATGGLLRPDGTFTCVCGEKTVKIEGLDAGQTYFVEETESGEFYEQMNQGIEEVVMPIYSSKKELIITNDYVKRSFSVSKQVFCDLSDPGKANEVAERQFTMTVKVNGKPLKEYHYTIFENGQTTGEHGKTNAEGMFALKCNQTAYFEDAGIRGDVVTVTETEDPDYPQIYPALHAPGKAILGEDTTITIVNGNGGGLLIDKTYVGKDEDAREYVSQVKANANSRKEHAVKIALYVTDKSGNTYQWPTYNQYVQVINHDGTTSELLWCAKGDVSDGTLKIEPWSTIYLNSKQLSGIVSYSLEEAETDRHQIREWKDGKWMVIRQDIPEGDRPVQGILKEKPVASIVNRVECVEPVGSVAEKRMQLGSDEVPEGARLIWRVEQYDGVGWSPAKGISYLTFDASKVTCSQIMKTGDDGKILLTKTANAFPSVRFLTDTVRLNFYKEAVKGDLRIVEVPEESDEYWGTLVGYAAADNLVDYSWDLSPEDAVAFVNGNCGAAIEVTKEMETVSEDTFTMYLRQVLSISRNPVMKPEDISADRAASGIAYQIYDSETGQNVGNGVTGAEGEILLKAGQSAHLEVPGDTLWTVSEQGKSSYVLQNLSGTPKVNTTKLGNNLMLIHRSVPKGQIEEISITRAMVNSGVMDAATRQKVKLSSGDVVIPKMIIQNDKVYVVTGIADGAFSDNQNLTGVTFPETLKTIGEKAFWICRNLTKGLVFPDGLTTIGASAFTGCNNLEGNLVLPDSVVSIGASAFSDCRKLSGELKIPDTIKSIGSNAFGACTGFTGTLVMPGSGTILGEQVFSNCHGITEVMIPEDVTRIENHTFFACKGLKRIKIPDQITSIGKYAFALCDALEEVEFGNHVEIIGAYAFQKCSSLKGQLGLPASITTIDTKAFIGCSRLASIYIDKPENSVEGSPWGFPKGEEGILWKN